MSPRRVPELDPAASFRLSSARIVRARLEELLALADEAMEPGAVDTQHRLRIAAKRLRYALEIGGRCLGEEAAAAREAARELQGALGELRDCDVLLPGVEGIESRAALLRDRRRSRFERFRALWREQLAAGTWDTLEQRLQERGAP